MLTEEVIIDQISIDEHEVMHVRQATVIYRDGEEIARQFHRHVVVPGDDLAREVLRVRAVGGLLHTPAVIASWRALVARRE